MGEARTKVARRIEALERENQGLRDVLFSLLKHQGRVRVPKAVVQSLQTGDGMAVREEGQDWVLTFEPNTQANGVA